MNLSLELNFDGLPAELMQRIQYARYSGTLTDCEVDVLAVLVVGPGGPRAGKAKAIQISAIQEIFTRKGGFIWSDRSIKDAVKQLLEVHGIPIGSSRASNCAGYYMIQEDSEVESTVRVWGAEIHSLLRRCKALSPKSSYVRGLLGQLSAEMEGAE